MDCSLPRSNNTNGVELQVREAEEKSDFEQSEKQVSPGRPSPGQTLPTFGTNLSVFSEVPRSKNASSNGLTVPESRNAPPINRAEPLTVPVKVLPAVNDAPETPAQNDPTKLPEFVDWSARTTSAMYKKLEQEVSRLRCDKQQAEERLDRSLQQTEMDRETIKRLQQDLREQREKVFEYERQIRASKTGANRLEDRDAHKTKPSTSDSSQQTNSTNDAFNWELEQKSQKIQLENDLLKRKIDELDEEIRRNDRQMRSVQEENRELRSRLDTDAARFATFEERIKQLEDALTRASQDNLQLIDQMRSQLLAEQARRSQLEQMNSIGAARVPPTRKTLTETAAYQSGTLSNTLHSRAIDAYRPPAVNTTVLSSPSEKEPSSFPTASNQFPEKSHQNETGYYGTAISAATAPTSTSTTAGSTQAAPVDNSSYSLASQPAQTAGLSSVSGFGLRRYLSLPPGARRQLTNRFFGRLHDAPSAIAENGSNASSVYTATNASTSQAAMSSVYNGPGSSSNSSSSSFPMANRTLNAKVEFDAASRAPPSGFVATSGSLPWSGSLHYDSATRNTAAKTTASGAQLTSMNPIAASSLSNKKLPAVPPAVVDQTAVQQANRLNLQEYRDFLKERRRKVIERETLQIQLAATELPAETV